MCNVPQKKKKTAASQFSPKQDLVVPVHIETNLYDLIFLIIPYWYYEYELYGLPIDCLLIVS